METMYRGVSIAVLAIALLNVAFSIFNKPSGDTSELEAMLSLLMWAKAVLALGCGIAAVAAFRKNELRLIIAALAAVTGLMAATTFSNSMDVLLVVVCTSLAVAAFCSRPRAN